ncbi:hypothetical protein TWF506_003692 [Arthrobotrys conoides]|uniref:F-box domain-containing protein n=1 Tax=Arthrobotrys conoides TaxID=74498 RepID=A0AAN8NLM8_9PEZI
MAQSSVQTKTPTSSPDDPPRKLFLLDMPVEVVERVFKHLDRKELKNVALCSSSTRNIVYPMLHDTLMLKFHHQEPINKNNCGLLPKFVENILSVVSTETLSLYQHLKTTSTFETHRRIRPSTPGSAYYKTITTRKPMTPMDDVMLRLVLQRLQKNQLLTIKFGSSTSIRTLGLILKSQKQITELSLGDFGSYSDLTEGYSIHPSFFGPTEIRLTTLEVGNLLQEATGTILKIIHQSSATLKRLRIGNPHHQIVPRFPPWKATTQDFYLGIVDRLPFVEIQFAALVQLHIVHDRQFSSFADILGEIVTGCTKLTRVRLSGCTGTLKFVRRLETAGARIEALQICQCNPENPSDPEVAEPIGWSDEEDSGSCVSRGYTLPYMSTLHTLQLTGYSHPDDDLPETYSFVNRQQIQSLWVGCQLPERDPFKCASTSALLKHSKLTDMVFLRSDNWQLLRELAIPNPGSLIVDLLFLKSLRALRLLKWQPTPPESRRFTTTQRQDVDITRKMNALLDDHFSDSPTARPPSVKLIIVDRSCCNNYCNRLASPQPCYLAVGVHVEQSCEGEKATKVSLYRPIMKNLDPDAALHVCLLFGCSTYMLAPGPPSPERFWEDKYAFAKGSS